MLLTPAPPPELCAESLHQPGSPSTLFPVGCGNAELTLLAQFLQPVAAWQTLCEPLPFSLQGKAWGGRCVPLVPALQSRHVPDVIFQMTPLNAKALSLKLWWGVRCELRNWTYIFSVAFSHHPWPGGPVPYGTRRRADRGCASAELTQTK